MASKYNLSETELMIMEYFWETRQPLTTHDVQKHFAVAQWAIQTVQTFLTRLVKKGSLKCIKQGRCYYEATMTEEEYAAKYLKDTIANSFDGSMKEFMVALRGVAADLNEAQKKKLRDIWNE